MYKLIKVLCKESEAEIMKHLLKHQCFCFFIRKGGEIRYDLGLLIANNGEN